MEQPKNGTASAKKVRKPVNQSKNKKKDGDIEGTASSSVSPPNPSVPPPGPQGG